MEKALEADNAELTARVKGLEAIIEGDRTKVIDLVNAISDAFTRRSWMLTSRGSYEWDDDGFRKEFSDAMEEIGAHVDAMRAVGCDWSNCSLKAEDIAEARIDWRKKAEALEAKLAAADKALEEIANSDDVDNALDPHRNKRLASEGIPMSKIAQYLGHSDSRITERVYARYSPHHMRDAAEALELDFVAINGGRYRD